MDRQEYFIVIFILIIALFTIDTIMNYRGLLFILGTSMAVALFLWSLVKVYLKPQKSTDNAVNDFESIINLEKEFKDENLSEIEREEITERIKQYHKNLDRQLGEEK